MLKSLKQKVYDVLIDVEVDKRADRLVALFLMILIIANGVAVMLETVKELETKYSRYFYLFELVQSQCSRWNTTATLGSNA